MRDIVHICDVLEPPNAQGDRGQLIGNDKTYIREVPCGIEHLSGREGEIARATFGAATVRVTMRGDPAKPIKPAMRLKVQGFAGERLLEIGDVKDVKQNGQLYELICGEANG